MMTRSGVRHNNADEKINRFEMKCEIEKKKAMDLAFKRRCLEHHHL